MELVIGKIEFSGYPTIKVSDEQLEIINRTKLFPVLRKVVREDWVDEEELTLP